MASAKMPNAKPKSYSYPRRAVIIQFITTLFVGVTYFGMGVLFMMPTVVVGNLVNSKDDIVSLDEEEGSWVGGLIFLVMPAGALLGILLQNYFGQRYGLILSNILALISLLNLYYATSSAAIMVFATLNGLSIGFTEVGGMSYISEYSEPKIRGFLCSGAIFIMSLGIFFESVVIAIVDWRTGTLICSVLPITSVFLLLLVPDSPIWLLSKGKQKKSLNALMWFRGWLTEEDVKEEFDEMCVYVRKSLTYTEHHTQEEKFDLTARSTDTNEAKMTSSNLSELLMSTLERRTLYPFSLLCVFQTVIMISCSFGAKTYVINLFDALQTPVNRKWASLSYGAAIAAGNLSITLVLKYTGKRMVAIVTVLSTSIISIALGAYAHYKDQLQMPWLLIILIFLLNFISSHCTAMPWLMMSEIFSVKNRALACGLASAAFDVIRFVFLKSYFSMDGLLGTEMYFILNGLGGVIGGMYLYFYLPETEGKSLGEIDTMFSTKSK